MHYGRILVDSEVKERVKTIIKVAYFSPASPLNKPNQETRIYNPVVPRKRQSA